MSLLSTLATLTKSVFVLTLVSGSLLANSALANGPAAEGKKEGTVETAAPVAPASTTSAAATLTLTGRIRNEQGQPLAGATVYLQGSRLAVSTDTEGKFVIEVPTAGKKTLRYGYSGYQDRDVVIGTTAPLTMSLQPSPKMTKRRNDK